MGNKNAVLTLYKILLTYTDEKHPISMREILEHMEEEGCACSEDSVGRYIRQIRTTMDVDIISGRGRNSGYFLADRLLEKEELKLLVDAVNASNFIEGTIAKQIIRKLKKTVSVYDAAELDRSVMGVNVAKAENKKILYNVNVLQEALQSGVQITFYNRAWNKQLRLEKKSERKNTLNPWTLIWANGRYYLYGYDVKEKDGRLAPRHYRVDKMTDITLLEEPRKGAEQFRSFDASTYVSRRIGMFSAEESEITVRIPEKLIGAFVDQFGKQITVCEEPDGKLLLTFYAAPTKLLLGWLLGLGNTEVVAPQKLTEQMLSLLKENMTYYEERN